MPDASEIRRRKRRCNKAVLAGASLMATALIIDTPIFVIRVVTTVAAIVGFCFVSYGVHVGWTVFYDRDNDGPSS
ncbi:MAG: hypothetical protein JWP61_602 [Friedmanniella sp.]|jgi:hypothetical protein|nr:hypothetical protein [Friedmanniella sp.]